MEKQYRTPLGAVLAVDLQLRCVSAETTSLGGGMRAESYNRVAVTALACIPRGQPSSKLTSKMFDVAEQLVGDVGLSCDACDVFACAAPPTSAIIELPSRSRSDHLCPGTDIEGASDRH